MKVNIQGNYNVFKNRASEQNVGKAKSGVSRDALKTDLNAITKGETKIPDKHMLAMKSDVQSYVYSPSASEQLEAIRERIKNGTYNVSAEDIADAIMGAGL